MEDAESPSPARSATAETFVVCYGRNSNGELGHKAANTSQTMQALPLPTPVRSVGAGLYHSFAVTAAGELFSWGAGSGGQLGVARADLQNPFGEAAGALVGHPKCVTGCGPTVVGAAGGRNMSLATTHSGDIYSWGRAASGQLGHGVATGPGATRRVTDYDLSEPRQVVADTFSAKLTKFSAVAAGEHFACAVTRAGEVYTWGCEANGQLGRSSKGYPAEPRALPRSVFGGEAVTVLACGWRHALACTAGGKLFSWGAGECGQLGRGGRKDVAAPARVEALDRERVERIAAGAHHSLATTAGGLVFAWGDNASGQCGLAEGVGVPVKGVGVRAAAEGMSTAEAPAALRPHALYSLLDNGPVVSLGAGAAHSVFVTGSGRLYACGDGSYGQLCAEAELLNASAGPEDGAPRVDATDAGSSPTRGTARLVPEPSLVPMAQAVVAAACGAYHTVLLMRAQVLAPLTAGGGVDTPADDEGMRDLEPLSATLASHVSLGDARAAMAMDLEGTAAAVVSDDPLR